MASNTEVIESLALQIDVRYKGDSVSKLTKDISTLKKPLKEVTKTLNQFVKALAKIDGAVVKDLAQASNAIEKMQKKGFGEHTDYQTDNYFKGREAAKTFEQYFKKNPYDELAKAETNRNDLFLSMQRDMEKTVGVVTRSVSQINGQLTTVGVDMSKMSEEYKISGRDVVDTSQTVTGELEGAVKTFQTLHNDSDKSTFLDFSSSMPLLDKIIDKMYDLRRAAEKAGIALKKLASSSVTKGFKNLKGMISSFARILKYRLIRTILKNVYEGFQTGIQNLARYSNSFNSTMSQFSTSVLYFKNALGTLSSGALTEVIPYFKDFIDNIVEVINKINEMVAVVNGEATYIKASSSYWVDYADQLDGTKKSADKLKNSLMGFDEINRIDDNNSSTEDYSKMFETVSTPVDSDLVEKLQAQFRVIEALIGAGLVVLGVVLIFTGHIAMGIACVLAGIKLQKATIDWAFATNSISSKFGVLLTICAAFIAIIGVFLLFTNHIPAGVACIIAGLGIFGIGATAIMWDTLSERTKSVVETILRIGGTLLVVIGIILCFTGHAWCGIPMIILGASAIVASTVLNWDSAKDPLLTAVETILGIAGALFVVIGVILCFTTHVGFGVAFIIAGAAALVGSACMGFSDETENKILQSFKNLFAIISGFMIVVGVILCLTGNFAVGLACLGSGALGLGMVMADFSWDALGENIKESLDISLGYIEDWASKIKEKFDQVKNWFKNLFNDKDNVEVNVTANGSTQKFATGGFPEDGIFMANHGELVGKFANGRTAVANNEQIEAGIEDAAYRGFMRALSNSNMGGNGGNYTFVAELNGKTLFEEVVSQNNRDMKFRGVNRLASI